MVAKGLVIAGQAEQVAHAQSVSTQQIALDGQAPELDPEELAYESTDGEAHYVLRDGSIWKVSAQSGEQTALVPDTRRIIGVIESGIFHVRYVGRQSASQFRLFRYDFV